MINTLIYFLTGSLLGWLLVGIVCYIVNPKEFFNFFNDGFNQGGIF